MRNVVTIFLATVAFGFTVGHASAAGYGYPSSGVLSGSPSLFSPSRYNWTNLYIGLNAGGVFGDYSANVTAGGLSADLGSVSGNGFIGGGQIGVNFQNGHVVFGVEADFQGTTQDHSQTFAVSSTPVSVTTSTPWLATIRGRLGWAWNNILAYGTGGAAFVDGKISATALGVTASIEKSHTGWTAGGGVEWAFAPQWTAKVEYLYVDSGDIELANVGGVAVNGQITDHIVRAGINYYISNIPYQ